MKDELADLIKRRHPLYEAMRSHWDFIEATYEGGRGWFAGNIFRYLKEGDKEYADRVLRAYRFNHTKQVVDLVNRYLFKMPIARKVDDAPDAIKRFWKEATTSGLDIDAFMQRVSTAASQFGRPWVVVDTNNGAGGTVMSVADEKAGNTRIYAYLVRPQDVLDMSYDDLGRLQWLLLREVSRDDADPFTSSGAMVCRFRLWTTESWFLFEEEEEGSGRKKRKTVVLVASGDHYLGEVPAVPADHVYSEELYAASGLVDDVAYLDRAVANYLSNLDAIIQDQSFSQLTMPAQGLMPGESGYEKLVEAGTKRAFLYNGEAGNKPEYIAPDPKQAGVISDVVGKIVNEIYHSVGLAAARTKDDNGAGADASGAAKSYDFEGINALLASKASALQITERRIARLVALWAGQEGAIAEDADLITYPKDFDVKDLYDEFEIAARLSLLAAPDDVRREQMAAVVKKLFPAASAELQKKLAAALKDWPPEDPLLAAGGLPGTKQPGAGAPIKAAATQKTAKELAS